MGVQLRDIVPAKQVTLESLSGRVIAIDGYNALYQFLAIIRGRMGEPLRDRSGRVTSHLSGLLYRTANLVEKGIKPIYVFDGTPPALKEAEIARRKRVREEALVKYEEALKSGDVETARRYAQMSATLKDYMVEDAKRLLTLLGIPWVQAPSEGEAQSAYMAMKGSAWAAGSQDFDALLFGAPRLVRNLSITGRRKLPRKNLYVKIQPEVIDLEETLKTLGITREQLVDIAILVGTDFNPEGVKGIGPKRALKLIKQYGTLERALESLNVEVEFPHPVDEIREIFLNPDVTDEYEVEWREPDEEGVVEFLCRERDFSEDRVRKALEKIKAAAKKPTTRKTTLEAWF